MKKAQIIKLSLSALAVTVATLASGEAMQRQALLAQQQLELQQRAERRAQQELERQQRQQQRAIEQAERNRLAEQAIQQQAEIAQAFLVHQQPLQQEAQALLRAQQEQELRLRAERRVQQKRDRQQRQQQAARQVELQRQQEEQNRLAAERAAQQQAEAQAQALLVQQQQGQDRLVAARAAQQEAEARRQAFLVQQQEAQARQVELQRQQQEQDRLVAARAAQQWGQAQQPASQQHLPKPVKIYQHQPINLPNPKMLRIHEQIQAINIAPGIIGYDRIVEDNDEAFHYPITLCLTAISTSGLSSQEKKQLAGELIKRTKEIQPEFPDDQPFLREFCYDPRIQSILDDIQKMVEALQPDHAMPILIPGHSIQRLIEAIPLAPEFKTSVQVVIQMKTQPQNINRQIISCISEIIKLPFNQRGQWLDLLTRRINSINPTYDKEKEVNLSRQFREACKEMNSEIEKARNAPMPVQVAPKQVAPKLNPQPVIVPLVAVDTVVNLDSVIDQLKKREVATYADVHTSRREERLQDYVIGHWKKYYKNPPINDNAIKGGLQGIFDQINRTGDLSVKKTAQKVAVVEKILQEMMEVTHQNGRTLGDVIQNMANNVRHNLANAVKAPPIFTRMEKIRELPSVDWDKVLSDHVYDVYSKLKPSSTENQSAYWTRMGDYVIKVYTDKVKPYIYPDGLHGSLKNNNEVQLIPFNVMFQDYNTSTNAVSKQEYYDFVISAANLRSKKDWSGGNDDILFKGGLADSYQKIHHYFIKTLAQLFNTNHPIKEGLNWNWYGGCVDDDQRLELCKRVLTTFAYLNRPGGNHFMDDIVDTAALAGGFTHCADGKKTAISTVSTRVLRALTGEEEVLVAEDFDSILKKRILPNFKMDTIDVLANHNHEENVSIIAAIKERYKDFWGVPYNIKANLEGNYRYCDYAYADDGFQVAYNKDVSDKILQHFYQHVYVGPHELVNTIHSYLKAGDVKRRADFLGVTITMLSRQRPFVELADDLFDCTPMVKARYCELFNQGPDDYIPTRKGLETILYYGGYLAWNGNENEHPLRKDWVETTGYLRQNHLDVYKNIYDQ